MLKTKLLYNPHAGLKNRLLGGAPISLQDIYALLYKYEIDFDTSALVKPGDARSLAREAAEQGYDLVIVAGGDGTVGEAATGLIGSTTALGILPLGTYMNVARMLSIPLNLEAAVMCIKMGKSRLLDVGEILYLEGEKVEEKPINETNYFLESVGIGIEADLQKFFLNFNKHRWQSLMQLIRDLRLFYTKPLTIELDQNRKIETKSQVVMISNGPYMGAQLTVAPTAKLNDHLLTITLFKMSKKKLLFHILKQKTFRFGGQAINKKIDIQTHTSTVVKVSSQQKHSVDADARVFGKTPISVQIKPATLKVIAGFAESKKESALLEKKIYISE